jgi:uncharacterized phiE125 gp8 family phage protein
MNVQLKTAPTLYPISMSELKMHLRVDSETLDGNLTLTQSLAYGSNAIANNYTIHVGTGVDVLGKQAEVIVHHGTNGATGTVDTKIQEAYVLAGPYTDWTGGAFTQVTTANDNADYKKQYTGSKQYIRTASKVLLAACEFGTSILVNAATTAEDTLLEDIRDAAIGHVEDITRRQIMTATWYYYLDAFPGDDFIKLPFGNLQSAGLVITYKDSDGTETTMALGTDYLIETNGEGIGRIVLPYGESWPSFTAYPSNPITIEFACGWAAAASVPKTIKAALLLICADLWANREGQTLSSFAYHDNPAVQRLLASQRLWDEFL